jgi:hypothetical protein
MVDRIGKGGPPLAPPPAEGAAGKGGAAEVERPFHEAIAPAKPVEGPEPVAVSPLQRLRAGDIDVGRYVEEKIVEATAHLEGLSPVELDAIRAMLREQLAVDPALTELVARLTALTGEPSEPK